jgi:uncharacterized membrane protein YkoI
MKNLLKIELSTLALAAFCSVLFLTSCKNTAIDGGVDPSSNSTTILDDKGVDLSKINAIIPTFIATDFAGYKVIKLETELENGETIYKVTVEKNGVKQVLRFIINGSKVELFDDKGGKREVKLGDDHCGKGSDDGSRSSSTNIVILRNLPAPIVPYILANYAGWAIVKAELENEDIGVVYKVRITKNGVRKDLLFDKDGKFLKEKK